MIAHILHYDIVYHIMLCYIVLYDIMHYIILEASASPVARAATDGAHVY